MVNSSIPSSSVAAPAVNTHPSVGQPVDNKENATILFLPITARGITLQNRIVVPPMCMYSAKDGFIKDYHLSHYGSLALRGPGMIIIEATAVDPRVHISPHYNSCKHFNWVYICFEQNAFIKFLVH